jgi:hypothetical protein
VNVGRSVLTVAPSDGARARAGRVLSRFTVTERLVLLPALSTAVPKAEPQPAVAEIVTFPFKSDPDTDFVGQRHVGLSLQSFCQLSMADRGKLMAITTLSEKPTESRVFQIAQEPRVMPLP